MTEPTGDEPLSASTDAERAQEPDTAPDIEADGPRPDTSRRTLLATLATRPGQVYSRHDLIAIVFPEAENEIVVDTYVHYLRRKLGRGVVATVRGRGYQLGRACGR